MKYYAVSMEEDSRRYREFMQTQLFRNACRTLRRTETEEGGLTPAEIWQEVEEMVNVLRGTEAEDREVMVSQMVTNLRRKLKEIVRDEVEVTIVGHHGTSPQPDSRVGERNCNPVTQTKFSTPLRG